MSWNPSDGKDLPLGKELAMGSDSAAPLGKDLPAQDTVLLTALHQDNETLDALARRTSDRSEPITELLSALSAEVDADLDVALARPLPVVAPLARERGNRRRTAGLAAAGAVALVLATGGVAAAATGNPLAPVNAVVAAVTGQHDDDQPVAGDAGDEGDGSQVGLDDPTEQDPTGGDHGKPSDLPTTAADQAQLNHLLVGISALIAHGEYVDAATQLSAAQQVALTLTDPLASWFDHRLDVLTAQLERAIARDASGHGKPDQPGNSGTHGKPDKPATGTGHGKPDQPGNSGTHGKPDKPATGSGHGKPDKPAAGSGHGKPDKPATGGGKG